MFHSHSVAYPVQCNAKSLSEIEASTELCLCVLQTSCAEIIALRNLELLERITFQTHLQTGWKVNNLTSFTMQAKRQIWSLPLLFLSFILATHIATPMGQADELKDSKFWFRTQGETIERMTKLDHKPRKAKNVIIFIGDGMGISTITGARILKRNRDKKAERLFFEHFPYSSLIKTANIDKEVPDSAGTATAIVCGSMANYFTLKVSGKIDSRNRNCEMIEREKIKSIMDWAQEVGKATGVVTNARITHATPAATYASVPHRNWESDETLPTNTTKGCKDIALQLIDDLPGRKLDVVFGGGRKNFFGPAYVDPDVNSRGSRKDGRDLTQRWISNQIKAGLSKDEFSYVSSRKEFEALDIEKTKKVFGLFHYGHLEYEIKDEKKLQPTLADMTDTAIKILKKNENGFVLLVEGARIDHAHHYNKGRLALEEVLGLERAVTKAYNAVSTNDTLLIVTADHSHGFTVNGYPSRNQSVFGITNDDASPGFESSYTILLYATGPGHKYNASLESLDTKQTEAVDYKQHSAVYTDQAAHGGEEVALYAEGPMAHLFSGLQDQPYIAHVIAYSACMANYKESAHCSEPSAAKSIVGLNYMVLLAIVINLTAQRFN